MKALNKQYNLAEILIVGGLIISIILNLYFIFGAYSSNNEVLEYELIAKLEEEKRVILEVKLDSLELINEEQIKEIDNTKESLRRIKINYNTPRSNKDKDLAIERAERIIDKIKKDLNAQVNLNNQELIDYIINESFIQ